MKGEIAVGLYVLVEVKKMDWGLHAEARKKAGLVACSIWFLSSCHIEYLNINLIFQALDEYIKYN